MTHELNSRKHFEWDNHKKTFQKISAIVTTNKHIMLNHVV